jgi:hypothetical protein
MEHDLLFHTLLLLGILWLSVILLWGWPRRQATTHHDDRQPTEQAVKRSQANKLFPGLTHKPLWTAYEDGAQKHAKASPCAPPPRIVSTRGCPRKVPTASHSCSHPHCDYYGWTTLGNRANGLRVGPLAAMALHRLR